MDPGGSLYSLAGAPQMSAFAGQAGPPEEPLPGGNDEESSPLFKSDDFRIWCMKVIPCTKRFVHDWTVCPFAHAGEKAVRRDPRTHNYTGIACPDMKKQSSCIRGDKCPYAHNVFEYWLHPTRYRTQLCNDGPTCKRSICFFAHSLEELRVPAVKPYVSPEALARASLEAIQQNPHPLGQQLPNPAAAMRAASAPGGMIPGMQQQGGTPRGMAPPPFGAHMQGGGGGGPGLAAGGRTFSGPYGFPGGMGGPAGPPLAAAYGAAPGFPGAGAGYGAPFPGAQQPRMSAPPRAASMDYGQQGPRRMSLEGMKLSLTPATPGWGGDAGGLGFPPSPAPASGWAPDFSGAGSLASSVGGAPPSFGGGPGSGYSTAPNSCRPSIDMAGFGGLTSSGGGLAGPGPATAAARMSSSSLAAAGAGGLARSGRGSADSLTGLDAVVHPSFDAPRAANRVPSLDGSDAGGAPGSDGAGSPAEASGAARLQAATEQDLAQSLATLKIALTQQHVAAAAGSNHEIVISTLHQILKDAIAQHGGKMPSLPGLGGSTSPPAAAAAAPAGGTLQLAAASALYASSGEAAPAPPPAARISAGSAQSGHSNGQGQAAQQQPWISTMGEIKWDAPAGGPAAAPSPSSTTPPAGGRLSGESASTQ